MKLVWNYRSISFQIQDTIMRYLVTLIFIYACESYSNSKAAKKNRGHGNEVLPPDTMHLIQRPFYQRGSQRKDSAGNRTIRRSHDHRKETQTEVVWTYLPFIRSGQNHLTRLSETEKKIRQTEEEVGRQHQEIDRLGVRQVPEGSGEEKKKM